MHQIGRFLWSLGYNYNFQDSHFTLLFLSTKYNTNNKNNKMIHREGVTTETKDWTMIQASSLIQNQNVIQMYVFICIRNNFLSF